MLFHFLVTWWDTHSSLTTPNSITYFTSQVFPLWSTTSEMLSIRIIWLRSPTWLTLWLDSTRIQSILFWDVGILSPWAFSSIFRLSSSYLGLWLFQTLGFKLRLLFKSPDLRNPDLRNPDPKSHNLLNLQKKSHNLSHSNFNRFNLKLHNLERFN